MIQKRLIHIVLFLLTTTYMHAQQFKGGMLAGLSTSQVDGDTQKDFKKLGIYAGVFVETNFTELVGAKIELYYIGKGAKKVVDDIEEFNTSLHYIDMPFLVTFKPLNKVQFDVGLAVSYLISSKLVGYGDAVPESQYDLNNFDIGAIATGTYFFGEKLGFNVRFEYSITPIKINHNWFNSNLSFGLLYKI